MTSPDFFHTVHRVLEDDLGSTTAEERDRCVRDLVTLASAASAAITLQPIPVLDVALLAPVQIAMVQGIAKVHGYAVDRRTVVEWIGTFGASILTRHLLLAVPIWSPSPPPPAHRGSAAGLLTEEELRAKPEEILRTF